MSGAVRPWMRLMYSIHAHMIYVAPCMLWLHRTPTRTAPLQYTSICLCTYIRDLCRQIPEKRVSERRKYRIIILL